MTLTVVECLFHFYPAFACTLLFRLYFYLQTMMTFPIFLTVLSSHLITNLFHLETLDIDLKVQLYQVESMVRFFVSVFISPFNLNACVQNPVENTQANFHVFTG